MRQRASRASPDAEATPAAVAAAADDDGKASLLLSLGQLFETVSSQKRIAGVLSPYEFVAQLRRSNEAFRSHMQQDAHEFLNYLLNTVAETLQREMRAAAVAAGRAPPPDGATWVHAIFEGMLTNETQCMVCESVSQKDEAFLDLSVDIMPNSSITYCLKYFSQTETLCCEQKYYCEHCRSYQEAHKRMRIKRLPKVLALHLKRFKYVEELQRYRKLHHRVVRAPPGRAAASIRARAGAGAGAGADARAACAAGVSL